MRTATSARSGPQAVCDALRDAFADTTAQAGRPSA
jgi:hypothetical protein